MDAVNVREYEDQLETLSKLLLEDPDNQELQALYDELAEVRSTYTPLIAPVCRLEPVEFFP
jgi:hypothetical protein